jgi:hypothetical protein
MINKNQTWLKYGLTYGVITILLTLFFIHVYFIGIWMQSIVSYLLLFLMFYLLAKSYKSQNEGFLSYGEAFKNLFLMSLVGFAILFIFNALYYNYINPEAADFINQKALESVESTMKSMGLPEDQVMLAMEESEKNRSNNFSISNLLMSFASTLVFVLILTAITALILKKDKK